MKNPAVGENRSRLCILPRIKGDLEWWVFDLNNSILGLEHFGNLGNFPAVHSIEARAVNIMFPRWARPLGLEGYEAGDSFGGEAV